MASVSTSLSCSRASSSTLSGRPPEKDEAYACAIGNWCDLVMIDGSMWRRPGVGYGVGGIEDAQRSRGCKSACRPLIKASIPLSVSSAAILAASLQ